jgi:NAD(P)H-dependent FMN reductase
MPVLKIIYTSTREGREGIAVASWFVTEARAHGKFEVDFVDLKEQALPLLDEPNHPVKRQYQHEHTKAWSRVVAAADAFVFVIPEYNYSMPPALLNALDYVFHEWHYTAAALVSYGGVSGGLRSAQMVRQVLPALRVMPLPVAVGVSYFAKQIAGGVFTPSEAQARSVTPMLDELLRWTEALAGLRAQKRSGLA